jgi:bla regulator protein blaR1
MTAMFGSVAITVGESIELSVVLKATCVLLMALAVVTFTRRGRASVRHLLLTSTFIILVLLPLVAATVPPFSIEIPASETFPVTSSPLVSSAPQEFVTSPPDRSSPVAYRSTAISWAVLFRLLWALGVISCLGSVARGLWRARHLRRHSLPWLGSNVRVSGLLGDPAIRGTVAFLLHEDVRSPATCGFVRPAIIFPIDAPEWSDEELRHAMVHELEHVRRADWIVHLVARIVCALYWFHPFVWVAWRHLSLEAELACDDAVLQGADRTRYAQQLVRLARRLSADSARPILSMASRGDLSARVSAVLDAGKARGRARMRHTAVILSAAVVVLTAISPLRAVAGLGRQSAAAGANAQSPTGTDTPRTFEVASIKPNNSGDWRKGMGPAPGGRFTATNVTFRELVPFAYGLSQATANIRIIGGPSWIDSDRFDVDAKGEGMPTPQEMSAMLRTLLAERFKLAAHTDTRELPIYALVMAKGGGGFGPKLQRSNVSEAACAARRAAIRRNEPVPPVLPGAVPVCGTGRSRPGSVMAVGYGLGWLTDTLGPFVGRVVLDRTGIAGLVDLNLEWTPDPIPQAQPDDPNPVRIDPNGPSIFSALQEQLGLKLESTKGPVDVLVVDHVEKPTED